MSKSEAKKAEVGKKGYTISCGPAAAVGAGSAGGAGVGGSGGSTFSSSTTFSIPASNITFSSTPSVPRPPQEVPSWDTLMKTALARMDVGRVSDAEIYLKMAAEVRMMRMLENEEFETVRERERAKIEE